MNKKYLLSENKSVIPQSPKSNYEGCPDSKDCLCIALTQVNNLASST